MKKNKLNKYFFIGPHLILFIVFIVIPTVYGIYISFTNWNLISKPVWVGLDNFRTILFDQNSTFYFQLRNGLKNTLYFVLITVPFQILIPLIIAVIMSNKDIKFKGFFQSILYLPGLISVSASALIWLLVVNPRLGLQNVFGSTTVWTVSEKHAWMLIAFMSLWGAIGGNLVIYRSAINAVPQDLYEAADLDGASRFRKFISITLPSIRFPLVYTIVMSTAAAFNVYAQPLMTTNGGPEEKTTVLMMYIRRLAFGTGESIAGMASAMALILGLVILIISSLQFILFYSSSKGVEVK